MKRILPLILLTAGLASGCAAGADGNYGTIEGATVEIRFAGYPDEEAPAYGVWRELKEDRETAATDGLTQADLKGSTLNASLAGHLPLQDYLLRTATDSSTLEQLHEGYLIFAGLQEPKKDYGFAAANELMHKGEFPDGQVREAYWESFETWLRAEGVADPATDLQDPAVGKKLWASALKHGVWMPMVRTYFLQHDLFVDEHLKPCGAMPTYNPSPRCA